MVILMVRFTGSPRILRHKDLWTGMIACLTKDTSSTFPSNAMAANSIAQKLVCGGRLTLLGNEATCLSCDPILSSLPAY